MTGLDIPSVVVELSLRPVAAALMVGLVLSLVRVRTSAARHAAWTAVLATMLLMPVLQVVVPPIAVSVPFSAALASHPRRPAPIEGVLDTIPPPDAQGTSTALSRDTVPVAPSSVRVGPAATVPIPARLQWNAVVALLYGFGLLLMLARLVTGWLAARRLVRESEPIEGLSPAHESRRITTPLTVGMVRPRILLPTTWRQWSPQTLAAVLAHERAHVRRRDVPIAVLARINRAVFWFHPLAWWLERQLAITAEHAADDSAVRELGEPDRYAEILVDMAAAAARGGKRVAWQGVGMDGSSRLTERIDRLLAGTNAQILSRTRKVLVWSGCLAAIIIAVACQRASQSAAPLTPDPDVADTLTRSKAAIAARRAAWSMTPQEVLALQDAWDRSPGDLLAAEKLLLHYQPVHEGRWMPDAKTWIVPRRRIALWLVQHHPESALNRLSRLGWGPNSLPDPEGLAQAGSLWMAAAARPDAAGHVLANAASFFRETEPRETERLLIRGRTNDPDGGLWVEDGTFYQGSWTTELGRLYADALLERVANASLTQQGVKSDRPNDFADEVRRTLEESRDAALLSATSEWIGPDRLARARCGGGNPCAGASAGLGVAATRTPLGFSGASETIEAGNLARQYADRALALKPDLPGAREALYRLDESARMRRLRTLTNDSRSAVTPRGPDWQYDAIAQLPDAERFSLLPAVAEVAYMVGESEDDLAVHPQYPRKGSNERARDAWAVSAKAAREALALAPKFRSTDDYGAVVWRAHLALGVAAIRARDKAEALRHLTAAATAPDSDGIRFESSANLEYRLTDALLDSGERETVARYYENMATKLVTTKKDASLKAAAAIRAGRMPEGYQRRHVGSS